MSLELLNTSSPRGVRPGATGFCTVGMTAGVSPVLEERLTLLSGYRWLVPPGEKGSEANPVAFAHWKLMVGGRTLSILSRVCDAGFDYSRRSNRIAHHVVLEPQEQAEAGPAWVMMQPGVMRTQWVGEPMIFEEGPDIPAGASPPRICQAWAAACGDAGSAGVLAGSFAGDPSRVSWVIYPPGLNMLALMDEAIALLPAGLRWQVTFSTYFTDLPAGMACAWRCCAAGSKAAADAARQASGVIIDLTVPLPPAPENPFVAMARSGSAGAEDAAPPSRRPAPPSGTGGPPVSSSRDSRGTTEGATFPRGTGGPPVSSSRDSRGTTEGATFPRGTGGPPVSSSRDSLGATEGATFPRGTGGPPVSSSRDSRGTTEGATFPRGTGGPPVSSSRDGLGATEGATFPRGTGGPPVSSSRDSHGTTEGATLSRWADSRPEPVATAPAAALIDDAWNGETTAPGEADESSISPTDADVSFFSTDARAVDRAPDGPAVDNVLPADFASDRQSPGDEHTRSSGASRAATSTAPPFSTTAKPAPKPPRRGSRAVFWTIALSWPVIVAGAAIWHVHRLEMSRPVTHSLAVLPGEPAPAVEKSSAAGDGAASVPLSVHRAVAQKLESTEKAAAGHEQTIAQLRAELAEMRNDLSAANIRAEGSRAALADMEKLKADYAAVEAKLAAATRPATAPAGAGPVDRPLVDRPLAGRAPADRTVELFRDELELWAGDDSAPPDSLQLDSYKPPDGLLIERQASRIVFKNLAASSGPDGARPPPVELAIIRIDGNRVVLGWIAVNRGQISTAIRAWWQMSRLTVQRRGQPVATVRFLPLRTATINVDREAPAALLPDVHWKEAVQQAVLAPPAALPAGWSARQKDARLVTISNDRIRDAAFDVQLSITDASDAQAQTTYAATYYRLLHVSEDGPSIAAKKAAAQRIAQTIKDLADESGTKAKDAAKQAELDSARQALETAAAAQREAEALRAAAEAAVAELRSMPPLTLHVVNRANGLVLSNLRIQRGP